jgi:predicted dehydrogenase
MSKSKPLRLLQIGMGGWGRSWAEGVVPKLKTVKAAGWVDANPDALETARNALQALKLRSRFWKLMRS